jgi:hypothetical protein
MFSNVTAIVAESFAAQYQAIRQRRQNLSKLLPWEIKES